MPEHPTETPTLGDEEEEQRNKALAEAQAKASQESEEADAAADEAEQWAAVAAKEAAEAAEAAEKAAAAAEARAAAAAHAGLEAEEAAEAAAIAEAEAAEAEAAAMAVDAAQIQYDAALVRHQYLEAAVAAKQADMAGLDFDLEQFLEDAAKANVGDATENFGEGLADLADDTLQAMWTAFGDSPLDDLRADLESAAEAVAKAKSSLDAAKAELITEQREADEAAEVAAEEAAEAAEAAAALQEATEASQAADAQYQQEANEAAEAAAEAAASAERAAAEAAEAEAAADELQDLISGDDAAPPGFVIPGSDHETAIAAEMDPREPRVATDAGATDESAGPGSLTADVVDPVTGDLGSDDPSAGRDGALSAPIGSGDQEQGIDLDRGVEHADGQHLPAEAPSPDIEGLDRVHGLGILGTEPVSPVGAAAVGTSATSDRMPPDDGPVIDVPREPDGPTDAYTPFDPGAEFGPRGIGEPPIADPTDEPLDFVHSTSQPVGDDVGSASPERPALTLEDAMEPDVDLSAQWSDDQVDDTYIDPDWPDDTLIEPEELTGGGIEPSSVIEGPEQEGPDDD